MLSSNTTFHEPLVKLLIQNNYYCIFFLWKIKNEPVFKLGVGHSWVEIETSTHTRKTLGRMWLHPWIKIFTHTRTLRVRYPSGFRFAD
ncbi:hypothetical protein Zm00014a_035938 [Zea mays]|uniref:Uncharacterized protein n=1 Tax=Zea mays TaxID=4577 RepID=A0A3L6E9T7_MAIZE|nr:hypothetical protein Zm00014a_035938 [Zea mays]